MIVFILIPLFILQSESRLIEYIQSNGCSNTWTLFRRNCYKMVSRISKSFEDADKLCRLNGASLLQINDEDTQQFINNMTFTRHEISRKEAQNNGYGYHGRVGNTHVTALWLGIKPKAVSVKVMYQNHSTENYSWLDGSPVEYNNFDGAMIDDDEDDEKMYQDYFHNKYIQFYCLLRVAKSSLCEAFNRDSDCKVGHWRIVTGSMSTYEVAGVLCQKRALSSNRAVTLSIGISFIVAVLVVLQLFK